MKFQKFPVKTTPLTNIEIDEYAKKLNLQHYIKHRMLDEVKSKAKVNECGIINLDVSSGAGTHYVCYFKKGNDKYYFDSYGIKPPDEIVNYLKSPILYSTFRIQQANETDCGKYCLYALYRLNNGDDFKALVFDLLSERKTEGL